MKIIKRSGMEVEFDRSKINNAVKRSQQQRCGAGSDER